MDLDDIMLIEAYQTRRETSQSSHLYMHSEGVKVTYIHRSGIRDKVGGIGKI